MNYFTILFLQNFNKIFSKNVLIAPFFKKKFGEHTPCPRNKILDTPLLKGPLMIYEVNLTETGLQIFMCRI